MNKMEKKQINLTESQQSLLDDITKGRGDPVYFAEKVLDIDLHDGQKKWLRETVKENRKRNILVPANSFGKTVVSAVKQIYYMYYKIGLEGEPDAVAKQEYRTAHMAPHSEQVHQCYNYIIQILTDSFPKSSGQVNNCRVKEILQSHGSTPRVNVKFTNKSKMMGFSTGDRLGSSFQGAQFGIITFDECCRDYHLEKIVTEDCLPRLIKHNGPVDLISTPWTESPSLQYYYRICQKGMRDEDGWYTQQGKMDANIFYDEKRRDQIKKNMMDTRPDLYDQVIKGEFVFVGGREFRAEDINNVFQDTNNRWTSDKPVIEAPSDNGHYILSWDWAFATSKESSWSVMIVINVKERPWGIDYFYRTRGSERTPEEQFELIRQIHTAYRATFVVDGQSAAGALVMDKLQDLNPKPFMSSKMGGKESEKRVMILRLQQALTWGKGSFEQYGKLRCSQYIEPLASELGVYTRDDARIENDCVMALGMAINYYEDTDVKVPYVTMKDSADEELSFQPTNL